MKFQRTQLLPFAAALALLAGLAPSVQAATVTAPAAGDIFLGFRASGGTGAGSSYIVNIGNDSTFRNATPSSTISLGSIGTDLAATYGATWYERTDLFWGSFGSRNTASPGLYASRAQSPVGTPAAAYPALSLGARSATNVQIVSVLFDYASLTAGANAAGGVQTNTPTSGSYSYQVATTGVTDFGSQSQWTSIEDAFSPAGGAGTALDLFRIFGNSVDGDVVERLGTITIDNSGAISFTAAPVINKVRVSSIATSVSENAGTVSLEFKRSGDLSSAITATYSLTDLTAAAGTDYTTPGVLTVNFASNVATASASVTIANRTGYFGNRTFRATVVSADGGFTPSAPTASTVTITDVDADPGAIDFSVSDFAATTADTTVNLTLQRTVGTSGAIAVNVVATGGSLVNGTGYTLAVPTTINFADGATTGSATITLSTLVPGTITLGLSSPTNFSRIGTLRPTATVTVSGTPGTLAFGAAQYSFPESSGTIQIPIVRTGGVSGAQTVTVNSANGSATAPTDYTAVTASVVNVGDGVSTVNVPVTLFDTIANETNETFTLTLSNVTGGAALGAIATTTIRILEFDTKIPTVAVTAPLPNAKIPSPDAVTVTGLTTDDKGVSRVVVRLNGGADTDAALTVNPAGTSATYTLAVTPVPGLNSLSVVAIDATGNESAPLLRTFTYVKSSNLTVSVVGGGTVPVAFLGTTAREEGKSYTILAKPNAGSIFAGWTGTGITGTIPGEQPSLTFVHSAGLTLTANFIANPFVAAIAGDYNGLVKANTSPAVTPSLSTEGFINVKVTGTGAFTGSLKIDGLSLPLKGAFNATGVARFCPPFTATAVLPRGIKPSYVLALTLDLDDSIAGTRKITGTLGEQFRTTITPLSTVSADRNGYDKATPVLAAKVATYTVVLPAQAQTNGLVASDYPQGDGFGTITVSSAGLVTFKGKLADDTAVTASAPLSKDDAAPLFAQIYANKGSWGGEITLSNQAESDLAGTTFRWFKPYIAGQHYPFGWLEGVTTQLRGAKYAVSAGTSILPDLAAVNPTLGNADLIFSDGLLTTTQAKSLNVSTTNVVTKVPVTNSTYTLTLIPAKGEFNGSFTHTDGTKPAFQGIIYQKGTNKGGYGYFLTTKPKVITGTGESGGVSLSAK
ncbi:MAG: beta strand repeat-containing protein [Verrucomicrobiaceae bacterium]